MPYLKDNYEELHKAVVEVLETIPDRKLEGCQYEENGEYGAGIYVYCCNNDMNCYLEEDHDNIDSFLDDLNTDAAILTLDAQHKILNRIPEGSGEHTVSWPEGELNRQPILKEIWDPKTCIFNWDKFNTISADLLARQRPNTFFGTRAKGIPNDLSNITDARGFDSSNQEQLQTGTLELPFAAYTQALRTRLGSKQTEERVYPY